MQLQISGRHIELGEAFQQHVEKRLQEGLSKYLERITSVTVVVAKQAHQKFRVDIHANPGTHSSLVLKSQGEAGEVHSAFDEAAMRIEKQLRRYKRRLKGHHPKTSAAAKKYVLEPEEAPELEEEGAPVVVAETATTIEHLTVSEAVMKMDLADLPALMFVNAGSGRLNVIYRRADGNISWVDPEGVAA